MKKLEQLALGQEQTQIYQTSQEMITFFKE